MAQAAELLALAERVEALIRPDRTADEMIAQSQGLRVVDEGHPLGRICYTADGQARCFLRYTDDLEAAMRLMDPAALWAIGRMEDGPFARLCWPMPDGGYTGGAVEGHAATVPLAMVAAALRGQALAKDLAGGEE